MAALKGVISAKKSNRGRKTDYQKSYAKLAYNYTLLGATDIDLAAYFGVTDRTINRWKKQHEDFCQSIKKGKEIADSKVAEKLYSRAIGYKFNEVHFEKVDQKENLEQSKESEITLDIYKKKVVTKEIPPDTTAQIFWLKNRQPKKWRDKQEHVLTGKNGGPIETTQTVVILPSNGHESEG